MRFHSIGWPTRAYERLLEVLFAALPLAGTLYLIEFQDAGLKFADHGFHILVTGLAVVLSGFIAYVTYLCYRSTRNSLLRYLTLSFLGFAVCYAPHSIFTLLADHNMKLFLIYGPVSRIAMNAFLMVGVLGYRPTEKKAEIPRRAGYWLKWMGGLLLLDLLVYWVVQFSLLPFPVLRVGLEAVSCAMAVFGVAVILYRHWYTSLVMKMFALALIYLVQGSATFLLASPWNHLWWYAHAVTAGGFFLLSYVVMRAYHAAGNLAEVYSLDEMVVALRNSEAQLGRVNHQLYESGHRLTEVNQKLFEANRQLEKLAMQDELTEAYNRRGFLKAAEKELARMRRTGAPGCLLMLDIDHFKQVNDRYGHDGGDLVLKGFAESVRQDLRPSDVFGRLGGEEFAVLLPDTPMESAARIAERIRSGIAAGKVEFGGREIRVTVSIGAAELSAAGGDTLQTMMNLADVRLYQAKASGRDRVVYSDAPST